MTLPVEAYRLRATMLALEPGLHVFRYERAVDQDNPPFFVVAPIPEDADAVEFMSSPGDRGAYLTKPGDMLVVKAKRSVKLTTLKTAYGRLGQEHVELTCLPLAPSTQRPPEELKATEQSPSARVELVKPRASTAEAASEPNDALRSRDGVTGPLATAAPSAIAPVTDQASSASQILIKLAGQNSWQTFALAALPRTFSAPVKSVRLVGKQTERGSRESMRLNVYFSDGQQQEYVGADIQSVAVGESSIIGLLAEPAAAAGSDSDEALHVLFRVDNLKEQQSQDSVAVAQKTLVRRRVGVLTES